MPQVTTQSYLNTHKALEVQHTYTNVLYLEKGVCQGATFASHVFVLPTK